jgi:hypothetical protein
MGNARDQDARAFVMSAGGPGDQRDGRGGGEYGYSFQGRGQVPEW